MSVDRSTELITSFASSSSFEKLTPGQIASTTRVHLDAIGCALGGMDAIPCVIAREVARESLSHQGCSVIGMVELVVPEHAVFANSSMIRQLDFNDAYLSRWSGHPSDMLPAIIAVAELTHATGKSVILGTEVAYEVFAALADTYNFLGYGWDNGALVAVGVAAGCGVIMGLRREEMANAISLALTPTMPMRSTRAGTLSHWKGCAMAHSASAGLFAARLAQHGMTGPEAPFEGVNGLDSHVEPAAELRLGEHGNDLSGVEKTSFKCYPAVFHSMPLIPAFIALRDRVQLSDVVRIRIETSHATLSEIGGGQNDQAEKWDPKTRETADHSLPYIAAVCLVDGTITPSSFSPERIADPDLRPLMNKISIVEREDLTADAIPRRSEITVELANGGTIELRSEDPRGHYKNPMTDAQFSDKFRSLASMHLDGPTVSSLESLLWNLSDVNDISELTSYFRSVVIDQ